MLCIQNCLVDSNWNVKLTNFVSEEIIHDKMRHNELKPLKLLNSVSWKILIKNKILFFHKSLKN